MRPIGQYLIASVLQEGVGNWGGNAARLQLLLPLHHHLDVALRLLPVIAIAYVDAVPKRGNSRLHRVTRR